MEVPTPYHVSTPEQTVMRIMRKLSPERVSELVEFARFLEFRATEYYWDWIEAESEQHDEVGAAHQRWDELFAQPAAKQAMRQMAREAQEEYRAGQTTGIAETDDGRLAPG